MFLGFWDVSIFLCLLFFALNEPQYSLFTFFWKNGKKILTCSPTLSYNYPKRHKTVDFLIESKLPCIFTILAKKIHSKSPKTSFFKKTF